MVAQAMCICSHTSASGHFQTVFPSNGLFFWQFSQETSCSTSCDMSGHQTTVLKAFSVAWLPGCVLWTSSIIINLSSALWKVQRPCRWFPLVLSVFQLPFWSVVQLLNIVFHHRYVSVWEHIELIDSIGGRFWYCSAWLSAGLRRRCQTERIRFSPRLMSRRRKAICLERLHVASASLTLILICSQIPSAKYPIWLL